MMRKITPDRFFKRRGIVQRIDKQMKQIRLVKRTAYKIWEKSTHVTDTEERLWKFLSDYANIK